MKYTTVKNLKWANQEKTLIDCEVDFDDLPEEFLPFTASPNDCMAHGVEIFQKCVAGVYGPIADFAPIVHSDEALSEAYRVERNQKLAASDWTQLPDVPASVKLAWSTYRQALRDVTLQAGFPRSVNWPTEPTT